MAWLRHAVTDGGYASPKLKAAMHRFGDWTFEIIKRSDTAKDFEPLPRRWVVERTFAWLGRSRRLRRTGRNPSPPPQPGSSSHPSDS